MDCCYWCPGLTRAGSGTVWDGVQYLVGRLETIPPLLFWEIPYGYVVAQTVETGHNVYLIIWIHLQQSYHSKRDFNQKCIRNRLSAGLCPVRLGELTTLPQDPRDLWEVTSGHGVNTKRRRETEEGRGNEARGRDNVTYRHLFLSLPALRLTK